MKVRHLFAPIAAALALTPLFSHAGLVVQISDGTSSVSIADNSAGDLIAEAGIVLAAGQYFGWVVTALGASSGPSPTNIHLTAGAVGTAGSQLWVNLTQTDLTAPSGPVTVQAEGAGCCGALGAQATWSGHVDDSNASFGTATEVYSGGGYQSSGGSTTASLSDSYSATLSTHFDYSNLATSIGASSLDVELRVPEPTSLALLGLGLLAAGATRRRRS